MNSDKRDKDRITNIMFSNDSNDAVCQGRRPGALTRLCTLRTRARLRSRASEADRRRGRESRGSLPPPFLPFAFGRRPRAPAAATTLPTAAALPQDAEEPFVFRRVRLDSLQYPIYIHRGISARPGRDGRLLGSPPSPTWCWGGGVLNAVVQSRVCIRAAMLQSPSRSAVLRLQGRRCKVSSCQLERRGTGAAAAASCASGPSRHRRRLRLGGVAHAYA